LALILDYVILNCVYYRDEKTHEKTDKQAEYPAWMWLVFVVYPFVPVINVVGFVFLLWTVISSLGMVEVSFNQIWGVAKPRPVWKRAYMYMFVSIILPVLVTLAMSLPILNVAKDVIVATLGATWLTKWVGDGLVWLLDSWIIRFAFTFAVASLNFALLFYLMPNCPVNFKAAWRGGAITAILYGGWMKACAIAQVGIAKSSALYGSFAIFPILLAWMYMSWEIILLGANMVYAFQKEIEK
jgi:membrane protein